jgi:hypothetical protein
MGIKATPFRRRVAMAVMLLLAVAGGVIRWYAPNPSTLRDLGSLLLVMWLPAVGNLIAFLVGRIPRSAPPVTEFTEGSAFSPQLHVQLAPSVPPKTLATLDAEQRRCTLLVGRHGFTARAAQPLAALLAAADAPPSAFELLHPKTALKRLVPGTRFHLLVGTTALAKGQVL